MTTNSNEPLRPKEAAKANQDRLVHARRQGHEDFVKHADENTSFLFSDQWEEKDKKVLRQTGRPYLTLNKIKPIIVSMMGEYQQNRVELKFIPAANGSPETADLLNKVFIDFASDQHLERKESEMFQEGLVTSRAYYDIRMSFDDNYKGKITLSCPNPRNVIPDPDADEYDPDSWNDVIVISRQTLDDIQKTYGKKKADEAEALGTTVQADNEAMLAREDTFAGKGADLDSPAEGVGIDRNRAEYLVIDRQYKVMEKVDFFVNQVTGDRARVPVDWDKEERDAHLEENPELQIEEHEAQVIRWTVSCGGALLHHKLSPYDFFTIIPFFPIFYRGRTAGIVGDLIDPQRNYNKLRSQELHIVNGTSNSGWKLKRGALVNMTASELESKGSMTGLVLEVADNPDDVQRIEPVQIPQGLDRISSKADADLGEISGIQDEARGIARADVAGKAIAERRQALLTSMAPYMTNMSFTHTILARRFLSLVQKYYDDERTISITTGGLVPTTETVTINEETSDGSIVNDITEGDFNVVVTSTAARDSFQNQQFNELVELQKLGTPVPSYLFVEASSWSRKEELAKELREAAGTATPSQEQREMEQQVQMLEMQMKQADIRNRIAQAMLSEARAKKVMSEIEGGTLSAKEEIELMLKAQQVDAAQQHEEASIDIRQRAQRTDELKTVLQDEREVEKIRQTMNPTQSSDAPGEDQ